MFKIWNNLCIILFQRARLFRLAYWEILLVLIIFFRNSTFEMTLIKGLSFYYRFLLMGKKKPYNKTSNYGIFMSQSSKEKKDFFLGKVRSNFLGTEFLIFDDGDKRKSGLKPNKQRKCLGGVIYVYFLNKGIKSLRYVRPP